APFIQTLAAPANAGVALSSRSAPAIGAPAGSVSRPTIVSRRVKVVVSRVPAVRRQRAVRVARGEAPVPVSVPAARLAGPCAAGGVPGLPVPGGLGLPGPPGVAVGFATVTVRSSTGAELPAASRTRTTR